jgi:ribosomal protein S18 acetylase RimI-like enzyme
MNPMDIDRCTLADFTPILAHLAEFWGDDRTRPVHLPLFIHEFGNSAFVVRDGLTVVAYVFGFCSQTEPAGYVHLIAVRAPYRRQGLARRLYRHFARFARERGCTSLKAVTMPENALSIAFHRSLGMQLMGEPNALGVPVVKDYSGPGKDRVVFRMEMTADELP